MGKGSAYAFYFSGSTELGSATSLPFAKKRAGEAACCREQFQVS